MPMISEQLPNLMNGVSQQAVTMRMASQAVEQINGLSSIVEGNIKRPPSRVVAKLTEGSLEGSYIHTINRDVDNRFIVVIDDGQLRVFDTEGAERTVSFPDGAGYLQSDNAKDSFRAVSVADYTFIVNKDVEVDTLPDKSPSNDKLATVFVKAVNYEVKYTVTIDGILAATYTAPATDDSQKLSVEDVCRNLRDSLEDGVQTGAIEGEYSIFKHGSIVYIRRIDAPLGTVVAEDDQGNTMISVFLQRTQSFTDLPTENANGRVIEVTGDDDSAFDNYYLRFVTEAKNRTFGSGYWEEALAPDIEYKLDPATMPHSLVHMPDGSFELRQVEWGERVAGDLESAPWPSFVGRTINDIYFDRRRLCFLSDDNVIMSEAGSFFNFFPQTVVTILDDGVIDVSATGTEVSRLEYASAFNKKIVLFAEQNQFVIEDEYLRASVPPGVKPITEYESSGGAAPVNAGRTLFFPFDRGSWGGVLEYYVMEDTDTTDAADITEHVPQYIPGGIFKLAASTTADIVVAASEESPSELFVYKYHWQGSKKLQSSWSRWQFPKDCVIRNVDFLKDDLLLISDYPDGSYLEALTVTESLAETGETYVCRLDRRVSDADVSGRAYDSEANTTTFTLPYVPYSSPLLVVTRSDGGAATDPTGRTLEVTDVSGSEVTVRGDASGASFFVGVPYDHAYTFSQATVKTSAANGGMATVLAGRLQLSRWHVTAYRTGYFRAEVQPRGRRKYVYPFTGTRIGGLNSKIGTLQLDDCNVSFRVNSRADQVTITLINDSFLPSSFTAAEWEGRFSRNTSRA